MIPLISKAAAGEPPVPVFDANGRLLGFCRPKDLQAIAQPPDPKDAENAKVAAQSAKIADLHAPPDPSAPGTVVAEVQKTVAPVLETMPRRTAAELEPLRKQAWNLDKQWSQLLEAAGPSRSIALKTAVANVALKAMVSGAKNGTRQVNIAKKAVLTAALNKKVI